MDDIKYKQEELYKKWQLSRDYQYFTFDGILNYRVWNESNPKILFLLKEAADDYTKIANNDVDITKGNGSHFWWNICYWKYIINSIHSAEIPSFIHTSGLPEVCFNNNILDSIAYVNIKKQCDNLTKSDNSQILSYAHTDKDFLAEQIDLIAPNIIFCSKTTFDAYTIIYSNVLIKLNDICYSHKDRLIIKFKHPSYFQISGGRETLFKTLTNFLISDAQLFKKFTWG